MRYHAIMQTNGATWITHANFATPEDAMKYVQVSDLVRVLGVVGSESLEASAFLMGARIHKAD